MCGEDEVEKYMAKLSEDELDRVAKGLYENTIRAYRTDEDLKDVFLFLHAPDGILSWPDEVLQQLGGIVADVKNCPNPRSWMPSKIQVIRKTDWKAIEERYNTIKAKVDEALEIHRKHKGGG